jgi:heme-degrading monooxygenase HmoA
MFAEVGRNTLDAQHPPDLDVVRQMQDVLSQQPGYRGYLAVDTADDQRVFVRLWDSAEAAEAARNSAAVKAFVARHVSPGVTRREVIGYGEVVHHDFSKL